MARSRAKIDKLTKEQIRSKILIELRNQKEEDRTRKSSRIKKKLFQTTAFKNARAVMFYIAFDGEVKTEEMIREALKSGKIVAVPVCKKDRINLRPCILDTATRLEKGLYGICKPAIEKFIRPQQIDLVIVPGVAFDKKGNRIGRGKGYYDRFLRSLAKRAFSIGLAFDFQILPALPAAAHDVHVRKVLFA